MHAGVMSEQQTARLQEALKRHTLEDTLRLYLRRSLQHLLPFASWLPGTRPTANNVTPAQKVAADAVVLSMREPGLSAFVSREHLLLAAALYSTTGTCSYLMYRPGLSTFGLSLGSTCPLLQPSTPPQP
jgi:hypothetical protein